MNTIKIKAVSTGRKAYQVVPDPDDPIILQIDGKLSRVLDISALGFSLPIEVVDAGRRYPFSLDMPTAKAPVSGYVDVLPDVTNGEMQGVFVNLSAEETESIHHYVLVRQKEALRSIRTSRSFNAGF